MKIIIKALLAVILAGLTACGASPTPWVPTVTPVATVTPAPRNVVLTMGSWRTEDVEQMNHILAIFEARYPNITVKYDPTISTEYDDALAAQLQSGTGPDVFYLRSYSISRQLFEAGYLEPLETLPGLMENFTPETRAPWATEAGQPYGIPFIATSHGLYYNRTIFNSLGLTPPVTWEELLTDAQKIKAAGMIPFANASGDAWTMAELVFMNLAPNFIGGRAGRMEYLQGQRCFNDAQIVATFQAVKDLAPFLSPDQAALTYPDSQQLFAQGRAAMFLDGSWDVAFFSDLSLPFEWGVFAPPPPAGSPPYLTFHLDAGMGLNAASKHKAEARLLLEWMTTAEFAAALGNELPGFFPMRSQPPALENRPANEFLSLNVGRGTDVRFVWEKLRDGNPSAYNLVESGAVGVVAGALSPQEAADALQQGLAQWYPPAQTCK